MRFFAFHRSIIAFPAAVFVLASILCDIDFGGIMTKQIVCLDGYTLNPGDIGWGPFEAIGEITVHDRTPEDHILARAAGASHLLTNKTPLSTDTLAQLPDLKYIGVLATGYNVVDVQAAAERDIVVTNVPTYGTDSVAQHATALMLELVRGVGVHHQAVRNGQWSSNDDWCFALQPVIELTGKTMAIVGLGRIGLALARIGAAMGMKLIAHDRYWPTPDRLGGLDVESVELDDAFQRADVISLHCPLTSENHHLVDAARLKTMKPTAVIINTSRGPLIDNQALADALRAGTIGGAGLDVLDVEPPPADNPLIGAPRCIVTPHIAWYAAEARSRLMQIAADNLQAFWNGKPVNVVSKK
jgi:glycerate dehydrogenase